MKLLISAEEVRKIVLQSLSDKFYHSELGTLLTDTLTPIVQRDNFKAFTFDGYSVEIGD